jgi:3-oxo-5alpha-steroid 4-dehydrogenase
LYGLLIFSRYAAMFAPLLTWIMRAALEGLEKRCGEPVSLRATRGVVVSTGGFFHDREMLETLSAPQYLPGTPLGTIGDDGSGILMAAGSGGCMRRDARPLAWHPTPT